MYEVCGFLYPDGSICQGLFNPTIDPPTPCIFPEDEADRCIAEIADLEPIPV